MVSILPINTISTTKPKYPLVQNTAPKNTTENLTEDAIKNAFPWIKDQNIILALNELTQITFDKADVEHLRNMGINIPFESGAQAVQSLKESNTRIVFDRMEGDVHAQYDFSQNFVKINSAYKNSLDTAVILAISEAILHEAGHARDNDNISSVQEELNFLGMNALAHRHLLKKYPQIFNTSNARIVQDGVSIYEKLFFDADPQKNALVSRVQIKYGYLPAGDSKHPASALALRIKGFQPTFTQKALLKSNLLNKILQSRLQ